ncbi:MAG: hypothetical protein BGO55_23145 [Sphingobacteriales bacterium 50-39]|nr:DUF5025 domain-containing protein [Sphingobacteriales bacterium]OJW58206.1 MAG: hypothetical protein BGO55_23145 [Sphingobacteriales bacterium 50-39]
MKKLWFAGLLLAAIGSACKKDVHTAPASYIEASINGVRVQFDTLVTALVDSSVQLIELSAYKGVPGMDTLIYSGGYQQTLSDFILLRIGYAHGNPVAAGARSDTALLRKDLALLYYGQYLNFTNQPNYDIYLDYPFSQVKATVTSVANNVIQGTFQGTIFAQSNTNNSVVIKDGRFRVKL